MSALPELMLSSICSGSRLPAAGGAAIPGLTPGGGYAGRSRAIPSIDRCEDNAGIFFTHLDTPTEQALGNR